MYILAIESSCDETSAAVISANDTELKICSNIVASQIDIHKLYGGVVPEIASRAHIEAVSKITYEAFEKANVQISDIECIGVTSEPGLIGALLVGVNFAKALSYANNIPLVPVHHVKGHIAANYFSAPDLKPPFCAFVASGGHTSIISVDGYCTYKTIGRTRDDAIGEAFDKVARVMGICYPGGAEMDRLATAGDADKIKFPLAAISDDTFDFSFSGLKTAVINYIHNETQKENEISKEDVAASFTKTVCISVVKKLQSAYEKTGFSSLAVAGGVAANSHLRKAISEFCDKNTIKLYMPPIKLCGDNGAMIAAQAYFEYKNGHFAGTSLNGKATSAL